jgi:hypothetical protein
MVAEARKRLESIKDRLKKALDRNQKIFAERRTRRRTMLRDEVEACGCKKHIDSYFLQINYLKVKLKLSSIIRMQETDMYVLERSGVGFNERFYIGYKQHQGALWGEIRKAVTYLDKAEAQKQSDRIDRLDGLYTHVSDRSDFI